jgi:hypothetical protein
LPRSISWLKGNAALPDWQRQTRSVDLPSTTHGTVQSPIGPCCDRQLTGSKQIPIFDHLLLTPPTVLASENKLTRSSSHARVSLPTSTNSSATCNSTGSAASGARSRSKD